MAHSYKTKNTGFGKLFSAAAIAAALCASSAASAGVLDFETELDSPFLLNAQRTEMGAYWVETYASGLAGGELMGAVIDNDACADGLSCPTNNSSRYMAALNDGYFYFGLTNDAPFQLKSLQASFIGAGQLSFPAISGYLVLQGFHANGTLDGAFMQLALGGPTGGSFKFASYDMGAFGNNTVDYVRILGYACPATGNCVRNTNWANFAIDNIITVPEPASWGLMGLGLLGLAAFSRRRAA